MQYTYTRSLSYALLALFISACTAIPPEPADWRATEQQRILPVKPTTGFVAYSPKWRAQATDAYADANAYITSYAAARKSTPWAVVMDIDQTVLNNVGYQIALDQRNASYSPATWRSWVEARQATLVPGAHRFIERVNALGGKVIFVSNRRSYEADATTDNLQRLGIQQPEDYLMLITRAWPEGEESKQERFSQLPDMLKQRGYSDVTIAAYVGDVVGDRPIENTTAFFCIPQGNLYGEPCTKHYLPKP